MNMLMTNWKITLAIFTMMVLICGLQGESDAYIDSIKPGPNDTSLIVTFTERIAGRINIGGANIIGNLSCTNSGTGTYLFEWREKSPQGDWQSVKKTYNYRWSSCYSTTRTESLTIEGLEPGTVYEVRYNSGAIHEGTTTTSFTPLLISTASVLTEATLGNGTVTLTLNNDAFEQDISYEQDITTITDAVTVSGIEGVMVDPTTVQRLSDTEITVALAFDGTDFDTDMALTFSVASSAIADYTGEDFTAEVPVTAIEESVSATVEVLIYIGHVWWIKPHEAAVEAETTKRLLQSANIQAEITQNENVVEQWMLQTASDGSVDVLIIYGIMPITIYPSGNAMPDGSVAEKWIETRDGNTILNHADYLGFWSPGSGNGQERELNGSGALRNLMDIPNISIPIGRADNTPMFVTTDGRTFTPSLVNFQSDRPFPLNQLQGDWFAEKVFASNTGNEEATLADPVIVRDGDRGRIAFVHQTASEKNPKGEVAAEIIINYLFASQTAPSMPDLVVEAVRTEPATVAPGEKFRLYATLKNQGTAESAATRVRYYRSTDNVISTADTQLSSASRDPLAPDATIRRYLTVTAPTTPGTYYYGVCVDSVSNESDTANNCSIGVALTVTEPTVLAEDVNDDGIVDVNDLVLVAQQYGQTGTNAADVNGDGVVNIDDLILVAAEIEADAMAAPSLHAEAFEGLSVADVKVWLSQARQRDLTDPSVQKGIQFLESLLASMVPKETELLANYPNPFNPETWIPYQLSKSANVTLHIYAANGRVVRILSLGHQPAGVYQNRSRAAYWDGRNAVGESVASGLYFYTLTAGDFTATRKMLILK